MKLKFTKFQNALEILGLLFIAGIIIFVCIKWNQLPDKIPGHYNSAGVIDRWGNKSEIFIMPIVGILLYIMITVLTFFPSVWNVPVLTNEENRETMYRCVRTLVIFTKIEMLALFACITVYMATVQRLPAIFLPVTMFVLFGTIIYGTIRTYQLAKK